MRVVGILLGIGIFLQAVACAQAEPAGLMNEADLHAKLVGNTLSGKYADGVTWCEYYDPSGEIKGTDTKQGRYVAKYKITNQFVSFDYSNGFADWTATIALNDGKVTFFQSGRLVPFVVDTRLLDGDQCSASGT